MPLTMGLMGASLLSAGMGIRSQRRQRRAELRAARARDRIQQIQQRHQKIQEARQTRMARADSVSGAEQMGIAGGSAALGAESSILAQFAGQRVMQSQVGAQSDIFNQAIRQAGNYQQSGQMWQGVGQLAGFGLSNIETLRGFGSEGMDMMRNVFSSAQAGGTTVAPTPAVKPPQQQSASMWTPNIGHGFKI